MTLGELFSFWGAWVCHWVGRMWHWCPGGMGVCLVNSEQLWLLTHYWCYTLNLAKSGNLTVLSLVIFYTCFWRTLSQLWVNSFGHSVLLRVIPQASQTLSPLSQPFLSQKWYWCGCLFLSLPWGLLCWRTHFIPHLHLGVLLSAGFPLSLQGGSLIICRLESLCVMWTMQTTWLPSLAFSFLFSVSLLFNHCCSTLSSLCC